jgi:hypothetical protein
VGVACGWDLDNSVWGTSHINIPFPNHLVMLSLIQHLILNQVQDDGKEQAQIL